MNALLSQHAGLVERLGWTLVHSLWQIAAIALALAASRPFVRSPEARYGLAMLAMGLCLAFPAGTFVHLALLSAPVEAVVAPGAVRDPASASLVTGIPGSEASAARVPTGRPVKISHLIVPSVSWRLRLRRALPWAVAAWLAGMGCLMLRHLAGLCSLHRLRTNGLVPVDDAVQALFEQARARLRVGRTVRLFQSARVMTPLVAGTLRPVVLLPASVITGLSSRQLEALLAHELAHLRRWDDLANLLQCGIETLLFYHPALWWISRTAREERELCCDDLAVSRGVAGADLAQALGRLALWQSSASQPALAATGHMPVLARIRRLLHPAPPVLAASPWPLAGIVLLATLVLLPSLQIKAQANPVRGRILDRNGLVLADCDAKGTRVYPYHALAAHIIGYTGPQARESKLPVGRSGIEQSQDMALGTKSDVQLALDARLQQIAENALGKSCRSGACVLIDPSNGDVLAMASWPTFDLNSFIPLSSAHFESLMKDPTVPLLPRAFQGHYFPGSTFKLVAALAALKSGVIDENTLFDGPPSLAIGDLVFHNWNKQGEGLLNLEGAIKRSCNTWFYQAALKTGSEPILDVAAQIGLGQPTGLPLTESTAALPSDESYQQRQGNKMPPGVLASMSIGQIVEVTPIQAAVAMAALGNGGKVWTPRLLLSEPASHLKNNLLDHGIKPEHLALLKKAMVSAVNAEDGTGSSARIPGITVAGKTGTAQWKIYPDESKNRNLAWLTGFAPAQHPRLAFAIVYEGSAGEKVSGGATCGPLVKAIIGESLAVLDGKNYEVQPIAPQPATKPRETSQARPPQGLLQPAALPKGQILGDQLPLPTLEELRHPLPSFVPIDLPAPRTPRPDPPMNDLSSTDHLRRALISR